MAQLIEVKDNTPTLKPLPDVEVEDRGAGFVMNDEPTASPHFIGLPELLSPDRDDSWRGRAKCRTAKMFDKKQKIMVPVDFFDYRHREAQQAACNECPVRGECLDFAVRNEQVHGYWGGHTPDEIKLIIKTRKALSNVAREAE